jgi:hypothetical protein
MNKYYFLVLSIILISNLSCAQTPDSFPVIDPVVDSTFAIYPSAGYMAPDYIKNKNYIVFQKNASERKILKGADVESFTFPRYNHDGLFALDKNGVYCNGDFIATDTTGFKILAEIRNTEYLARRDLVWKTKYNFLKTISRLQKILISKVSDQPVTLQRFILKTKIIFITILKR